MATKTKRRVEAELPARVERRLDAIAEYYIRKGLSTEPADRASAERGFRMAYLDAGMEPPEVRWELSPWAGVRAAAVEMGCDTSGSLSATCYGQHEAWVAFYAAFRRHIRTGKRDSSHGLRAIDLIYRSTGWWWPLEGLVIASDRPCAIHLDDRNELSRADGYAIEYRDGWGLAFWGGTAIPEEAVLAEGWLTVQRIKEQDNVEVRRALRELYGEGRYLAETGMTVIHMDYEGAKTGAAPRALVRDSEGRLFLVGNDGSRDTYYMDVSQDATTCEEAHRSRTGFDEQRIVNKS